MAHLAEVLKELQGERDRLEQAIKALQPLVSMNGQPTRREGARRGLSAAGRRRIAAAARARWARVRAGKSKTNSAKPRSRVVSIAARRKMAAAQKARRSRERAQQSKKAA
jgi:hypothetical protein